MYFYSSCLFFVSLGCLPLPRLPLYLRLCYFRSHLSPLEDLQLAGGLLDCREEVTPCLRRGPVQARLVLFELPAMPSQSCSVSGCIIRQGKSRRKKEVLSKHKNARACLPQKGKRTTFAKSTDNCVRRASVCTRRTISCVNSSRRS